MKDMEFRIKDTMEEIKAACFRAGREPGEVRLVVVSKNFNQQRIEEAYACGLRIFGENRVQELIEKIEVLPTDIEWHLIGTLQRNKVKYILGKVSLIHSVHSLSLAAEISKQSVMADLVTNILLQVNVSGEASKHGFCPQELLSQIKEICHMPGIKIKGLMTIAPMAEDSEEARPVFCELYHLAREIDRLGLSGVEMQELSMGMSDDFQVAVEEGATLLRIGSRIFGPRNYGDVV